MKGNLKTRGSAGLLVVSWCAREQWVFCNVSLVKQEITLGSCAAFRCCYGDAQLISSRADNFIQPPPASCQSAGCPQAIDRAVSLAEMCRSLSSGHAWSLRAGGAFASEEGRSLARAEAQPLPGIVLCHARA
ncbi:hypothetical protein SKAU_G00181830 [Synaphobranchus kaupii]|uniref:Uncharacterized protein n=1 Tax=Synaphobranchus kaupii TaxID=118154 RepID=A0A9Q1IVG7_SYNKA|nr:hypothetical protein SKAU_G00181830 [Synaphobranchus kaupii]